MKDKINFPIEGWSTLFADSNPTWSDYKEWLSSEEKHMVTAIYALYAITNQPNDCLRFKIENPPTKKELVKAITEIYGKLVLKKRKQLAEEILKSADYILSMANESGR